MTFHYPKGEFNVERKSHPVLFGLHLSHRNHVPHLRTSGEPFRKIGLHPIDESVVVGQRFPFS